MGALGPVISKDFVYISKIFKDDRELTPEEMSTMVDVRAESPLGRAKQNLKTNLKPL